MKKFPSTIYLNPVLPPGFYWLKLVDVESEHCGAERPRLWLNFEVGPMHEGFARRHLCTIIHPTEKARFYYVNFVNAFRVVGMDFTGAIGRWASVAVAPAEFNGTTYSTLRFTHQPLPLRNSASQIEHAEAEGRLDEWVAFKASS